jgi:hypothetical protein
MYTEQLTQGLSIQGRIDPVQQAAGTVTISAGVDMQKFRRAIFILDVGVFGASATVDLKLVEDTQSSLATATDVASDTSLTNVAITQLVAGGGNNRLASLEIRSDQVAKRYVGVKVTVGTAATFISVLGLGGESVEKPGSLNDAAAVAQRLVAT